jgi:hypothetical protein
VELGIFGGKLMAEERKNQLKGFYSFMTEEIQKRYNSRYPVSESDFVNILTPEYNKHLADLVIRMCSYPRIAILVPRFFDLFAYEVILGGKKI